MLKNKFGEVFLPVLLGFQIAFAVIGAAAVWHIPAWNEAKKNGTTAAYQAQKMWPQQLFAKLPGGDNYKNNSVVTFPTPPVVGNGGNFPGGNSNPNFVQ